MLFWPEKCLVIMQGERGSLRDLQRYHRGPSQPQSQPLVIEEEEIMTQDVEPVIAQLNVTR